MLDFHSRQGYIHPFPWRPQSLTSPLYGNLCPGLPAKLLITPSPLPSECQGSAHTVPHSSHAKIKLSQMKKCGRRCVMLSDDDGRVRFTRACLPNASLSTRLCCTLPSNRKPEFISSQASLLTLYSTKKPKQQQATRLKAEEVKYQIGCDVNICFAHFV